MKKLKTLIVTCTLLFAGYTMAQSFEDNDFVTIDKTHLDYSKNEMAIVTVTEAGMNLEKYSINYDFSDNILYVDFDVTFIDFLASQVRSSAALLPNNYRYFITGTNTQEVTLVVRIRDLDSGENPQFREIATFPLQLTRSLTNNEMAITDPSGTWYTPALSGTGFFIMQYGNGTEVWYNGYDAEGKPLWLLSDVIDETWVAGEPKTFVMYEGAPDAMTNFTTPPANAPGINPWGSLQLQFDTCTTGSATLTGNDGTQTYTLEKLANPINVNCLRRF